MPLGTKNKVIAGAGLHHLALQVRDMAASLHFYQTVLGMEIVADFVGKASQRRIVLLDIGDGSFLELFSPAANTPPPGSPAPNDPLTHLALTTRDVRAATEHLRRAGCRITVEPKAVTLQDIRATIAFVEGPNGEVIELFQTD